uniref:UBR-type domain-containing protein n=1 Tax=Parastrongyloides trichosuri TaxID=131310 RepID=A0A0N4Z768_PARTI
MDKDQVSVHSENDPETDTDTCASSTAAMTNLDDDTDRVISLTEFVDYCKTEDERIATLTCASDGKICTYPEGYKTRQLLFSCLTCREKTGKDAAICFGCSMHCHQDHDVIELYTKRNFCCDCGNSNFSNFKCELYEDKDPINKNNVYSHNFEGKYCSCDELYTGAEEMLQCNACEDWFHLEHLLKEGQEREIAMNADELYCKECITKLEFLKYYNAIQDVALENIDEKIKEESCRLARIKMYIKEHEIKLITSDETCYFNKYSWRESICVCNTCTYMYEDLGCNWLTEPGDSLAVYYKDAPDFDNEEKTPQDVIKEVLAETSKTYGHEASIFIAENIENITNQVVSGLKRKFEEKGGQPINSEDMRSLLDELELPTKKWRPETEDP